MTLCRFFKNNKFNHYLFEDIKFTTYVCIEEIRFSLLIRVYESLTKENQL